MPFEKIKEKFPGVEITPTGYFETNDGSEGHEVAFKDHGQWKEIAEALKGLAELTGNDNFGGRMRLDQGPTGETNPKFGYRGFQPGEMFMYITENELNTLSEKLLAEEMAKGGGVAKGGAVAQEEFVETGSTIGGKIDELEAEIVRLEAKIAAAKLKENQQSTMLGRSTATETSKKERCSRISSSNRW
jgi:hypothetical protein